MIRLARALGLLLLVLGGALILLLGAIYQAPATVLRTALRWADLPVTLQQAAWRDGNLHLQGIESPDRDLAATGVTLRFDLTGGAWRQPVAAIDVDGLRARLHVDERGVIRAGPFVIAPGAAGEGRGGLPPIPPPRAVSFSDARLDLTTPYGRLHQAFDLDAALNYQTVRADLTLRQPEPMTVGDTPAGDGATGRAPEDAASASPNATAIASASERAAYAVGALALTVPLRGQALPDPKRIQAQGAVTFAAPSLRLPDGSVLAANLPLSLDAERGVLRAELLDGTLRPASLPPALGGLIGVPPTLRLGTGAPLVLRLGRDCTAQGPLRLAAEALRLDGEIDLRQAGCAGTPDLALVLSTATAADARLDLALDLRAEAGGGLAGELRAQADLTPPAGLPLRAERLALDVHGDVVIDPSARVTVNLGAPSRIDLRRLRLPQQPFLVPRAELRVTETSSVRLDAALARRAVRVTLGNVALDAELRGTPLGPVTARLSSLDVDARAVPGGVRAEAEISGGTLQAPDRQLRLNGLSARLPLASGASIVLRGRLSSTARPAWFTPLTLALSGRRRGRTLPFELRVDGANGALDGRINALWRQDSPLRGTLALRPLRFGADGVEVAQLSPRLARVWRGASGRLAAKGTVDFARAGTALDVIAEDLGGVTPYGVVEGLNGTLRITGLDPFATAPQQRLTAARLDPGLPLNDVALTFALDSTALRLNNARAAFAGGTVGIAPGLYPFDGGPLNLRLAAADVALADLLARVAVDGLSGEGRLRADLPLALSDGALRVDDGVIEATAPGVLRYTPQEWPPVLQNQGQSVSLLREALSDFRFDELRAGVNGQLGGQLRAQLRLQGANPDLYDGHPIQFNLNLDGAIGALLQSTRRSANLPARLRERLQNGDARP